MAGIYFHIPFCKVKCSYCDFYKTTNTDLIEQLVKTLKRELWIRRDYLSDQHIKTIYFGGGTPSLLKKSQFDELLLACSTVFNVDNEVEITVEANPDDLTPEYLESLMETEVNRLSIGIQSFGNADLKLMKRRHSPSQAIEAVNNAQKAGFDNIGVDLIYGVPGMSLEQWKNNLETVFSMNIQHVSAYHLTYHHGTKLFHDLEKGKIREVGEGNSLNQYQMLIDFAKKNDFIHYEISNFAKEGFFSKHNSSYWKQEEYLGLGPSAHSYNLLSRQWNLASLDKYLHDLKENQIPCEKEILTMKDRYNDYVITSLRTMFGMDLSYIKQEFGEEYVLHVENVLKKFENVQNIVKDERYIKLSITGRFLSDSIMSDFMK